MARTATPRPGPAPAAAETPAATKPVTPGVRERKRRELRQKLSDTATLMFLEHGFDAVRVADVAKACGVSTKTVWNHFPTKEALMFDRGETLAATLRAAADVPTDVLAAVVSCIRTEIERLDETGPAGAMANENDTIRMVRAFAQLCASNADLRAATADQLENLTQLAAVALEKKNGTPAMSPENQITASALVSLWRVHLSALLRHSAEQRSLANVRRAALAEVEAGADVVARVMRTPVEPP